MNRRSIFSVFLPGLLLLAACTPAATPVPTATSILATFTLPPTATFTPVITSTPIPSSTPKVSLKAVGTRPPKALQDAIFDAARNDDLAAMKQLIANGADINDGGELGVPVLKIAVARNNVEMTKLLLDAGATIDAATFILVITHSNGSLELVQYFVDHGADVNAPAVGIPAHAPLMYAAEFGYVEIGKLLLEKGADINKWDSFGDAALAVAAFHGQMDFVKMLVAKGADLNFRGQYGNTAVGHARRANHPDIADYLKSLGAPE